MMRRVAVGSTSQQCQVSSFQFPAIRCYCVSFHKFMNVIYNTALLIMLLLCCSCLNVDNRGQADAWKKVGVDLSNVDHDGLRGPADGKVAVSYEFCIPDTPEHRAAVRAIDPTVQFMPGSRGRIGAGKGQCLCIGSTHQKDYKAVLRSLAELPSINRIIECYFE